MKRPWMILLLPTLLPAAFFVSPTVEWEDHRQFSLVLSKASKAETDVLYCHEAGQADGGDIIEILRGEENMPGMEMLFQPVDVTADGRFTVDVPTFGTSRCWGLWRTRGMCGNVILMGRRKTGERTFASVSVRTKQPITLK
mgnify:CR=1 FL=1